jgi:hypothetical protein
MKGIFGSSSKKNTSATTDSTWKPSVAPRASQLRGSTIDGSVVSLIRGDKKSFGRAITDSVGPPIKKSQSLAPRGHVEPYDMIRRLKSAEHKVDFLCTEFAWWWKIVLEEEHNCFQNVFWLLEVAVTHLRTGKGSQDVLALITNTVALLYLYGYLNLTTNSPPQAVELHGKLMTLLVNFDDKEARDRTEVEMCAIDLIVKIKNAANGQFRPLYTDLQDYTSFGSMEGLASQMSALGGGGGLGLLMSSKSWFDMPDKYGFSFFWPRLVQSLDDEDEMNQVFTRVKSFLERHGESLGSTSRVQILVLIMMLREFITMRPTADVNWLCATIEAIKPYFQWPRPYSLIARQLLEDLSRECLCPGSALRRRLRLEHPDLNPAMSREDTDRDPAMTIGDLTPGHGMVHVMFDTSSPLAQTYKEFFDLPQQSLMRTAGRASVDDGRASTVERNLGEAMLRSVKESIILQMLAFEYDLKSHADAGDPLKLQQCSNAQIDKWYQDACKVETRVERLKFGSFGERIAVTKIVRESLMGAILSEIQGTPEHGFALLRCKEEGHASALRRNSVRRITGMNAPVAPPKGLPKAQNGVPVPPPPPSPSGAPPGPNKPAAPPIVAPPPSNSDGMHIQKDGFDRRYQFYIPNLDFRFWPTDSTRTSSWSLLDKLRAEKNQQAGEKRSRLRKSASHLVLGQTTGAFNVIYASELAAGGGVVEGDDDEGEVPQVPVLFFPEDVDIIEHLCEGAMDTLARSDSMSTIDLNHNDYSDNNNNNGDVKPVVKLVVMGDNATVHRFVLAFFAFQRLNPKLHSSVRINVFLVPLQEERNDLARCLALSDPWYQRHVFAAFSNGLNLTPRFIVPEPIPPGIAQELQMRDLLPVEKLRCLLQDYTRIATQEVPISAFECQCWTPKGSILPNKRSSSAMVRESSVSRGDAAKIAEEDPPDLVIPFLTSAQVGLLVDVQLFRRGIQDSKRATDRSADGRLRLKDVLKEESFPSTLMPYKPKELLVVAFPPTMHDDEEDVKTSTNNNDDGAPTTDDEKKKNRGMDLTQLAEEIPEEGEGAEDDGPKVKKYTSLLFTNVSGCISDEVLAEELDSLEPDKVKALMQDPMFGNSPTHRDLKMHSREWGGKTAEILSLKNLKSSSFGRGDPCDQLVSSLREDIKGADANQKAIGGVSIEGAKRVSPDGKESQELFGIMLDGVVHGPFKRVVISPMYLGDQQTVAKVPFVTFLPQTV